MFLCCCCLHFSQSKIRHLWWSWILDNENKNKNKLSLKIDYFCTVPCLMSHINTWAQVPLPREGSWYWTHSLEPMDFSDWYPSAFVLLYISHLTFFVLGTLMSPTTNMALRTVQWSTGRRCPRGCTSGTTIFVLHPNMEMIGLSFPFVRGLWNEQMLNTGSVFTLLPWQNIGVIINSQTVCLYIWFKIILFPWGFRS